MQPFRRYKSDKAEQLNSAVQNSIEKSKNEIIKIDEQIGIISGNIAEINTVRDTLLANISGSKFDQISGELKALNEEENENKGKLDELKHRKDDIQRTAQQTAAARELFINMQPMTSFDDIIDPPINS